MRACVLHAAEDLRLQEWHQPDLARDSVRIQFGAGGICGSDLHYYFEGRVGITLRAVSAIFLSSSRLSSGMRWPGPSSKLDRTLST